MALVWPDFCANHLFEGGDGLVVLLVRGEGASLELQETPLSHRNVKNLDLAKFERSPEQLKVLLEGWQDLTAIGSNSISANVNLVCGSSYLRNEPLPRTRMPGASDGDTGFRLSAGGNVSSPQRDGKAKAEQDDVGLRSTGNTRGCV